MQIKIGDYIIVADERQYVVKEKRKIEAGALTKEENVGREYYQSIGYFTDFKSALKFIPDKAIRSSDEVQEIISKLNDIHADIKALPDPIKVEVEKIVFKDKMEGELSC